MKCPTCNADIITPTENPVKCEYCGNIIDPPKNDLSSSNNIVQNISINLNSDNLNTSNNNSLVQSSPKSKGLAIFLCLLTFIGIGGLHHFYVGKKALGILNLLTFGLFFIGAIVDLISLSKGRFTDAYGLPLT